MDRKSGENKMTTEEMERRWPECPPNRAGVVSITFKTNIKECHLSFPIDQDSIDEIIEYFEAAREAMND